VKLCRLRPLPLGLCVVLAAACSSPSRTPAHFTQIASTALASATSRSSSIASAPTAKPATVTVTPATAQATGTYTVKSGDTLAMIAKVVGSNLTALRAINPGVNPDALQIGQQLRLPTGGQPSPNSVAPTQVNQARAPASDTTGPATPTQATSGAPSGATALCNDGAYDSRSHRQGSCSGHKGVARYLVPLPP
jgi:LysM repeat protein